MASLTAAPPAKILAPRRSVHLYSRPHIDLQRVAGALCCS
ncbi:putative leader peptide [Streptomyces corynorhini]|nr:putative leader peptide [Streptomyces corynorhini]